MRKIKWERWENLSYVENEDDEENSIKHPFIQTPYGAVPYKMFAPNKSNLNFWVGNTNFDIDEKFSTILENTKGVEIVDIFSPYKFRIAIGLAFKENVVKNRIEYRLGCNNKTKLPTEVKKKVLELKDSSKFWVLYVLPNGKYDSIILENDKDLRITVDRYKEVKSKIGGILLNSGV